MDWMYRNLVQVDWHSMFDPTTSVLDVVLRGTAVYLALFAMLRLFRNRHAGELGVSDLLLITLIADAVQNGMASKYRSLTEGMALAATIFFWAFFLDWLAYRYPRLRWLTQSRARPVVRDGRMIPGNMRRELLTEAGLMELLRKQGIGSLEHVRRAAVESDGALSVLSRGSKE